MPPARALRRATATSRSRRLIEAQLRAYIGRNTKLEDNGFYANIYPVDNVIVRAVGILKEDKND